ncbi:MAG: murein biosynthesis integral membrane protein MurJ [Clostridia bacterium]|nr:murein biosynthesis integral membrane protein MurJ [Clostridia bacterium]
MSGGNKSGTKAVKTVAVMMGATVIAKLLGMLRGILQARAYGTTLAANAFTAASKLPLTFFDLFLSAAVLGCFIPVYNSFHEKDEEADRFACIFLNFIMLLCGVLALVGILFAEPLILLITQDLDDATLSLAVALTRIMFPLVIFTGAAYTLVGVLQSKGSFILPALISAISNAGVVLYFLLINDSLGSAGIYGLAAAYLLSWLIQLLTLAVPLWRRGFRWRLLLDFRNPALRKAIKMAPPIMVGSWLAPAGTLIGQFFASQVAVSGATTMFDYANNIYVIIAGTLTYSICNYTFPKIARMSADGDEAGFASMVRSGILSALYIVVPFMAAALVLSGEGVTILYRRGVFTAEDAAYTAKALRFILPAMPFFCVTELFSRVFYSREQVRVPAVAAISGIAANFAVGFFLVKAGLFDIGAVGASNAAGQIVCALVMLAFAVKRLPGVFNRALVLDTLKILAGGGLVLICCLGLSRLVNSQPYEASFFTNLWKAMVIFLPSAAVYLGFTKLTRVRFGRS